MSKTMENFIKEQVVISEHITKITDSFFNKPILNWKHYIEKKPSLHIKK